uniref:Uncharacterized protein n=1 Tax=Tanacetum cinerariifolium TaxID=118510 RepID=A0A6L2J2K9_TANCI|nr:hypothetical protein [Tanacetum cinerariifolium]
MNSYTFMGLDDVEEEEEISSRKKSFIKRAIAFIKIRRQANRVTRNNITRDRAGAHERSKTRHRIGLFGYWRFESVRPNSRLARFLRPDFNGQIVVGVDDMQIVVDMLDRVSFAFQKKDTVVRNYLSFVTME